VERVDCIGNQFFLQRDFQRAANYYERAITLDGSYAIARYQYLVGVQEERENNVQSQRSSDIKTPLRLTRSLWMLTQSWVVS
jgi:hypothetical protein